MLATGSLSQYKTFTWTK